jgi:beta-glucosidase
LAIVDEQGAFCLEPGEIRLFMGGQQPDVKSRSLTGTEVMETALFLSGSVLKLEDIE